MSYVQFYTDEKYEKVNKESKIILDDYILELKSKGRAKRTIEQYVFDLKLFMCYVYEHANNRSFLELKKRDFRSFFLMLQEDGKSSARINRVQSSIRNLLEFIVDDDDEYPGYVKNQMKSIKSLEKNPVKEIVFLTDEQVTFLIDYLLGRNKIQRALFVSLAYDSAGRRNELWQVEKYSFLNNETRTNIVEGKGGKTFSLFYLDRTSDIAKKWLEKRGEDDIDSLWVSYYNGKARTLTYDTLYDWSVSFRDILQEEYDEYIPLTAHSFRHCALENYENGTHHSLKYMNKDNLDINTLRILANHNDVSITQSYLKNKDEEILNELFSN